MPDLAKKNLCLALIGSADFCRRTTSLVASSSIPLRTVGGLYAEAWSLLLTHRPNILLLEIGFHYSEKNHVAARKLLEQVRERYSTGIYIIVALSAPERFFFGGDLLFASENEAAASGFVDTFIVAPPRRNSFGGTA